ncbi:glycerophosphodiester phosphodiesterase family protein [Cytophagaceae bacterium ABcell3]|nr:glycerophosphodiester phosphodiesterase family protein [Cytophagaceae bacterium ABcell3]
MKALSIHKKLIIAHRGTTYWAPEETEAAMRWARNMGADYLEIDLQRTLDGYLIALHDENLQRTTDIAIKFPDRKDEPASAFTYEELLTLDAGSWFNQRYPSRACAAFENQDILTLEDVVMIAEGKRIKRDIFGKRLLYQDTCGRVRTVYENDPADNGNRPGVYAETKIPELFPGIEHDLKAELLKLGWYNTDPKKLKNISVRRNRISKGNSVERIILQTFSKESLKTLNKLFSAHVPLCFLLWRGLEGDDIPDDNLETFKDWLCFGKAHGATIAGPSISGGPNYYPNLLSPIHATLLKQAGLKIHPYSFDTNEQMQIFSPLADGVFTNRTDDALLYYHLNAGLPLPVDHAPAELVLEKLGYKSLSELHL